MEDRILVVHELLGPYTIKEKEFLIDEFKDELLEGQVHLYKVLNGEWYHYMYDMQSINGYWTEVVTEENLQGQGQS